MYKKCLKNHKGKLCKEGYCTAKMLYKKTPSAYSNGYAAQVCKGMKKDYEGKIINKPSFNKDSDLRRWYKEEWVNLCKPNPKRKTGYEPCGSGDDPYCRAWYKREGTKVITAENLTDKQIKKMCKRKQNKEMMIQLPKSLKDTLKIPEYVKKDAQMGIKLLELGFAGGVQTGKNRAYQLANDKYINATSLKVMRAWYARHGPDAKTGGTSYPGYLKWVADGKPMDKKSKNKYRGAVSWLIWGGDGAYKWLKTKKIRTYLKEKYPKLKEASIKNNLK